MILGGGKLLSYRAEQALGVNPSAAGGQVVIDRTPLPSASFGLSVGDYVAYSFDAFASFYGVVSEAVETAADPSSGVVHGFTVLDNRIRLQWAEVFGMFNMEDELVSRVFGRVDAPSPPGDSSSHGNDDVDIGIGVGGDYSIDFDEDPSAPDDSGLVRRRYWSILPEHWKSGIRTWHDEPFTAREILNFAFEGAWGSFGFTRAYHSALDSLVLTGLDYNLGIRLGNLVSEINSKAGLELAIDGARTLRWFRRGEGLPPVPDSICSDRSAGQAFHAESTAVRVIGEPVRVQVANVELEPDWKPGWEAWVDELAWRREVASAFEMPTETKADHANLSAFTREVTVYQFAKQKDDASLLDGRAYGGIARNNLSAWVYIQEIVFRSYRIPPTRKLYGIPLSSLVMADGLLVGTDIHGEGGDAQQDYVSNPPEFYPQARAQVIHKGQPLDFLKARDVRLFYKNARDLRDEWTVATDFEVDPLNMSVRFSAPVFIDDPEDNGKTLYHRLNRGEGGGADVSGEVSAGNDYLDVVVPNPDVEIGAAGVKASFCFLLAPYFRDYGVGPRRGVHKADGLGLHLVDIQGTGTFNAAGTAAFDKTGLTLPASGAASFREILYEDGGKAEEKADAAASSVLGLSAIQDSGGFTRRGSAVTSVSGMVDRVQVTVDGSAVSEVVGFTKARGTGVALSERTMRRIQRTEERFPGQDALKNEIRQYRLIAAAERTGRRQDRSRSHGAFADVFSTPIGSDVQATAILYDKNSAAPTRDDIKAWKAGDIVWVDGDGWPSSTGQGLGGILVSTPVSVTPEGGGEEEQTKELVVATKGVVPVRVRAPLEAGSDVRADKGDWYGSAEGGVSIGLLMHGDDVPEPAGADKEVLAMVSLGFGGGGSSATGPCYFGEVVTWDEDGSGSGSGDAVTGIRGGPIEAGEDQWWEPHHEVSLTTPREKLLWMELPVTVNKTVGGEATLSGVKSGPKEGLTWHEGDVSGGYPDKDVPEMFAEGETTIDGTGKIVLPVGRITVAGGVLTLEPTGCGGFLVTHCPGVLSHDRIEGPSGSGSGSGG